MSDSKELLRRLRKIASELKTAAEWNGSGLAVDATKDDYLYEMYCYFRAALAAKHYFTIHVTGKTMTRRGKPTAKWPKKPGLKKNFSFLSLCDESESEERFQLCPGIRIEDQHGKDRAPDLSLQVAGASSDPTYEDVLSIWDAKYTSKANSRLPDLAVSDFAFTFQQLDNPCAPREWLEKIRDDEWQRSGLLTNARPSTEPDETLAKYGISETSAFPDGPSQTRP